MREDTYTQHLITCNDAVNSQRINTDKLEKHIAEVKALVEQAVEKRRDHKYLGNKADPPSLCVGDRYLRGCHTRRLSARR